MTDPLTLAIISAVFLLGGAVKGVIGAGLVTIVIGLLTAAIGLTEAMAVLLVPSFVTNFWQAISGGNTRILLQRLWPFFSLATLMIFVGAMALTRVNLAWLSALLGVSLIVYSAVSLAGRKITVPEHNEPWVGPLAGAVNGLLTGMTGSFVVPGVFYLQAIGLGRHQLIQAMGMLFTVSMAALGAALTNASLMTGELWLISFAATIPTFIGWGLGGLIRHRLTESVFRRVFLISLLLLGLYIIAGALA